MFFYSSFYCTSIKKTGTFNVFPAYFIKILNNICLKITTNSMYLNFFFIIEGWEILFSVEFNKQILLKPIFEMELRLDILVNQ